MFTSLDREGLLALALGLTWGVVAWLWARLLVQREGSRRLLADVLNLQAELSAQRRINAALGLNALYTLPGVSARVVSSDGAESGREAYNQLLAEELSEALGPGWKVEVSDDPLPLADPQAPGDDLQFEIWRRDGKHLG